MSRVTELHQLPQPHVVQSKNYRRIRDDIYSKSLKTGYPPLPPPPPGIISTPKIDLEVSDQAKNPTTLIGKKVTPDCTPPTPRPVTQGKNHFRPSPFFFYMSLGGLFGRFFDRQNAGRFKICLLLAWKFCIFLKTRKTPFSGGANLALFGVPPLFRLFHFFSLFL